MKLPTVMFTRSKALRGVGVIVGFIVGTAIAMYFVNWFWSVTI